MTSDTANYELALLCPLTRYILEKNTETLKRILRKRKKNPTQLQSDLAGRTALYVAASNDEYADCLKLLLVNKDTLQLNIDARTLNGDTALHLACSKGCVKNCGILLESECNPEIPKTNGFTPLHTASTNGRADIVSKLIAHGSNPNCCVRARTKSTPLHLASYHDNVEVVRVLTTSKQTKVNICDWLGELPLHKACSKGSLEIVRILLEADRSLIDCCSRQRFTPLTIATGFGRVECVKYLLEQGANANHSTKDHQTILRYAFACGNKEIMSLVLDKTDPAYIREQSMLEISGFLSRCWGSHLSSLMSSLILFSRLPEFMSLLESRMPKSILETPYLRYRENNKTCYVYSPLAYLFHAAGISRIRDKVDELLQLLLQYNITHLHEFSKMVELKGVRIKSVLYVHPFTNILEGRWSIDKRNELLKTLFEYGITTDYCLQCDVHYKGSFLDFDVIDLERFYQPVVWAVEKDEEKIIELLLINSAILEPSHLWNFLQCRSPVSENQRNVVDYLIDLGVNVNTSNLPSYPFGGTNLQQLCRQVIRKHLRDVTVQDNLRNFKDKINSLPLPNVLKDYLNFKIR